MPSLPGGQSTLLVLAGIGLPPYAARGLHQTLEPAAAGVNMRRTVNGGLVNLAPPQFAKYKSRVTGNDQQPPAIDGIFPGLPVTVDCIAELAFTASAAAERPMVPGSDHVEGAFTFYRPQLEMLITGFSVDTDEWGAQISWTLDLEEI